MFYSNNEIETLPYKQGVRSSNLRWVTNKKKTGKQAKHLFPGLFLLKLSPYQKRARMRKLQN